jgi:hypothetical protein
MARPDAELTKLIFGKCGMIKLRLLKFDIFV